MCQSTKIYDICNIYDDDNQYLVPSMFQSTKIYNIYNIYNIYDDDNQNFIPSMFQSTKIYNIYNIYDDDNQNLVPSMSQSTKIYNIYNIYDDDNQNLVPSIPRTLPWPEPKSRPLNSSDPPKSAISTVTISKIWFPPYGTHQTWRAPNPNDWVRRRTTVVEVRWAIRECCRTEANGYASS
jgi:hypothetical protein